MTEPPDADVVLISQAVESQNREQLEGFARVGELRHLWWFPNSAYANLTPLGVLGVAFNRDAWRTVSDYFLARQLDRAMYQSTGVVYVSDELAHLAEGCSDLRAARGL